MTSGFYFLDRLQVAPERAAQLVGIALVVAGLAVAVTQALVRTLKWPPLLLIRLGVPLTLASFVVLTLSTTFPLLVTAFALLGLGFGLLYPEARKETLAFTTRLSVMTFSWPSEANFIHFTRFNFIASGAGLEQLGRECPPI